MPVFQLTDELVFPSPDLATEDGLLAVGGDLALDRLLLAYKEGIFPWYSEGDPILWWSPDPRMVLFPGEFRPSRSLRRLGRTGRFRITADSAFAQVIEACATMPRQGQDGTWITSAMERAYSDLHAAGYAHSVECWDGDRLVGGLYGVSLGRCFFGESMFSKVSNTSKLAMWALVEQLERWNFSIIDCQIYTEHIAGLGARSIPREEFRRLLRQGLQNETRRGRWQLDTDAFEKSLNQGPV